MRQSGNCSSCGLPLRRHEQDNGICDRCEAGDVFLCDDPEGSWIADVQREMELERRA